MNKRIGILDSGIGGTSLLRQLIKQELACDYYYISDSINVPYGDRDQKFMLERVSLMVQELIEQDIDSVVVACNTLTAETIDDLRRSFEITLFGIEPYINYLNIEASSDERVGLILTPATFNSERFQQLREDKDPQNKIKIFPLKRLALIIEHAQDIKKSDLEAELAELKNEKLQTLILGCTHYPLVAKAIEEILQVKTVDPNQNVIKHMISSLNLKPGTTGSICYRQNLTDKWRAIESLPELRVHRE